MPDWENIHQTICKLLDLYGTQREAGRPQPEVTDEAVVLEGTLFGLDSDDQSLSSFIRQEAERFVQRRNWPDDWGDLETIADRVTTECRNWLTGAIRYGLLQRHREEAEKNRQQGKTDHALTTHFIRGLLGGIYSRALRTSIELRFEHHQVDVEPDLYQTTVNWARIDVLQRESKWARDEDSRARLEKELGKQLLPLIDWRTEQAVKGYKDKEDIFTSVAEECRARMVAVDAFISSAYIDSVIRSIRRQVTEGPSIVPIEGEPGPDEDNLEETLDCPQKAQERLHNLFLERVAGRAAYVHRRRLIVLLHTPFLTHGGRDSIGLAISGGELADLLQEQPSTISRDKQYLQAQLNVRPLRYRGVEDWRRGWYRATCIVSRLVLDPGAVDKLLKPPKHEQAVSTLGALLRLAQVDGRNECHRLSRQQDYAPWVEWCIGENLVNISVEGILIPDLELPDPLKPWRVTVSDINYTWRETQ